jgi:hypothetical protein
MSHFVTVQRCIRKQARSVMSLVWKITAAAILILGLIDFAQADDQQPYIVLTPAQPKAMQPFDVDAYFVGPPSTFKVYAVAETLHEIAADDTFTCGDACTPSFEHVHVTVPGIRVGTYSLVFRAVGDFPALYASFSVTVTTDFVITPGVEGSDLTGFS